MPDPEISVEVAKLVPVLIGGLLAVAGGFGGQIITHWLTRKRERMSVRRERLETLVKAVYSYRQWVTEKSTALIFRKQDHDSPSPLDEASMIQSLYFPELAAEITAVEKAYIPLLEFMNAERIKHLKSREDFIAQYNPAPFNDAYMKHLEAIAALVKKCRSLLPE